MITLSGGPYDGKKLEFQGGDFLEMSPIPKTEFAASIPNLSSEPVKFEILIYRRSMRNSQIFVFQP
jgi:hypothetical protein